MPTQKRLFWLPRFDMELSAVPFYDDGIPAGFKTQQIAFFGGGVAFGLEPLQPVLKGLVLLHIASPFLEIQFHS